MGTLLTPQIFYLSSFPFFGFERGMNATHFVVPCGAEHRAKCLVRLTLERPFIMRTYAPRPRRRSH